MRQLAVAFSCLLVVGLLFQNCGSPVKFGVDESKLGTLGVCDGISCDLEPLTDKPAVTTILIALGDEANDQLVVNGASSQLIAETVIRYTSPQNNPKILLVRDSNTGGEDPEDTQYIERLLSRYNVTFLQEPSGGLSPADLEGYDLIWFNNPGHQMSQVETFNALLNFAGAVVMQGDDLTRGNGFEMGALTGLRHVDNGATLTCAGTIHSIDNNSGAQYNVTLDSTKIPGADASTISFQYGNDIDMSEIIREDLEVLAWAKASPAECTSQRPGIVRWTK